MLGHLLAQDGEGGARPRARALVARECECEDVLLAVVGLALVSAQERNRNVGCTRRIAFDFASDTNPAVSIEWTSSNDPTGTVYTPDQNNLCTTGLGGFGSSGPTCPTDGLPYGMTGPMGGAFDSGNAPSGKIRIRNVANDAFSTPPGRPIDLVLSVVPDVEMTAYTSLLEMGFNSPVMPYDNDVPATQFRLLPTGLVGLGFGLLPANCPYATPTRTAGADVPFCNQLNSTVGKAAEYLGEFVYGGNNFNYAAMEPVSPPMDPIDVVFFDVDGDDVNNGLGGGASPLTDQAGVPPVPQDNDPTNGLVFPASIVQEQALEYQAVRNASLVSYVGSEVVLGEFDDPTVGAGGYVHGRAPANVPTDLFVHPYEDLNASFTPTNQQAMAIYKTQQITRFNIMIGGLSGVGRQYRGGAPYAIPKRQNDRGYFFSLLYPEPLCTCNDPCPPECADTTTAPTYCARNPNCGCPAACIVPPPLQPPNECGASCVCPSIRCTPAVSPECFGPLRGYYAYCKRNANCGCPSYCSACSATVRPGSDVNCAIICDQFVGCPGVECPTCSAAPPFPPPFPPVQCDAWCNEYTCGSEECSGCSICSSVSSGSFCAGWCNMYTCGHEHCRGCSSCYASSGSSCSPWCSAYTCFGSCTSCSVCQQVASNSYCASWCNAYTCGGMLSGLCGGCSECSAVNAGTYCASWCNSYTCGGMFSSMCGGCSACAGR